MRTSIGDCDRYEAGLLSILYSQLFAWHRAEFVILHQNVLMNWCAISYYFAKQGIELGTVHTSHKITEKGNTLAKMSDVTCFLILTLILTLRK